MNLKTKVIAAEVGNLTDARYFAAWGVDYMSYHIDPTDAQYIGVEAIKEIIDWVEGPQSLGYLSGVNMPDTLSSDYLSLGLGGLVANSFLDTAQLFNVSGKVYREITDINTLAEMNEELIIVRPTAEIKLEEFTTEIKKAAKNNEVYVDGITSLTSLKKLLEEAAPTGIVLRGGEEEKVGFKSYDELDEIFEWLEVD